MLYRRIDQSTGLFKEDIMVEKPAPDLVATPVPDGLYWPKWSNGQWVEGRTAAEIAPILAAKAQAEAEQTNRLSIEDLALKALATNKAYINSTPTAAQTTAEVKALARQVNGIIRLLLNKLDATD